MHANDTEPPDEWYEQFGKDLDESRAFIDENGDTRVPLTPPPPPPELKVHGTISQEISHPNISHAAESLRAIGKAFIPELALVDMMDILRRSLVNDRDGLGILFTQAQVLDSLFNRMTIKALSGVDDKGNPARDYVDNARIELALRTQKQCRSTLEMTHVLRDKQERSEKEQKKRGRLNQKEFDRW